jgi:EpsI family protein
LNFLLTALALSLLYGKLTYTTLRARVLCVVTALFVAIAANIARIYLIIVLTQVTHRKLDIADDHLLYGWGFFAVIMLGMMWLGGKLARPSTTAVSTPERAGPRPVPTARLAVTVAVAVIMAAIPPSLAAASLSTVRAAQTLAMPDTVGSWTKVDGAAPSWRPATETGAVVGQASYAWNGAHADVVIAAYPAQGNGLEAASAENQPAEKPWEELAHGTAQVETGAAAIPVSMTVIRNGGVTRAVLSWYESAGCVTPSRLRAKICAALVRVRGRAAPGAFVAISTWRGENGGGDATLADLARALMLVKPDQLVSQTTAE